MTDLAKVARFFCVCAHVTLTVCTIFTYGYAALPLVPWMLTTLLIANVFQLISLLAEPEKTSTFITTTFAIGFYATLLICGVTLLLPAWVVIILLGFRTLGLLVILLVTLGAVAKAAEQK